MISRQIFEDTFNIETAQALQTWANNNLITPDFGDYAMRIESLNAGGQSFAEIEMTGLATDTEATVRMYFEDIVSNNFSIRLNTIPNDNTSTQIEYGWGEGQREFTFTPSASTMYLAIGDNIGAIGTTFCIVDNISIRQGSTEFIYNGTFEGNVTTPWYDQNSSASLSIYDHTPVAPPVDNPYLEPVNIPAFDIGNAAHVRIPTDAPMSDATFNNLSYTNFYVEPVDYGSQVITITTSGTNNNRRTISLYNGNDTHPGKLNKSELANYQLLLNGADYWTIDRWSAWNNGDYMIDIRDSSFNIFNRMYTDDVGCTVIIKNLSHGNTFQQSRMENHRDPGYDGSTQIQIAPWGANYAQVHNTKVISNEFYNANDGFQVFRGPVNDYQTPYQDINAEGTIIYDNDFYKDVAYMENACDIKAGSDNSANPVLIENNRMWGYVGHADYVPGSYGPGRTAINTHYTPKNVHIKNNVIFDSARALGSGSNGPASGFDKGLVDSVVTGNLVYNCGLPDEYGSNFDNNPFEISTTVNTQVESNMILNHQAPSGFLYAYNNYGGSTFGSNDIVNGLYAIRFYESNDGGDSTYDASLTTNINNSGNTASAAGYTDNFVFTYDKYTNSPQVMTLTNAVKP